MGKNEVREKHLKNSTVHARICLFAARVSNVQMSPNLHEHHTLAHLACKKISGCFFLFLVILLFTGVM